MIFDWGVHIRAVRKSEELQSSRSVLVSSWVSEPHGSFVFAHCAFDLNIGWCNKRCEELNHSVFPWDVVQLINDLAFKLFQISIGLSLLIFLYFSHESSLFFKSLLELLLSDLRALWGSLRYCDRFVMHTLFIVEIDVLIFLNVQRCWTNLILDERRWIIFWSTLILFLMPSNEMHAI